MPLRRGAGGDSSQCHFVMKVRLQWLDEHSGVVVATADPFFPHWEKLGTQGADPASDMEVLVLRRADQNPYFNVSIQVGAEHILITVGFL
jgi:hypothetical protein